MRTTQQKQIKDAKQNISAAHGASPRRPPIASWQALLRQAITTPGLIHEAYQRFHQYSLRNQLLAMVQCVEHGINPGPIATFKQWEALGRHVLRGQKALVLCVPVTPKVAEPKDDDLTNAAPAEEPARLFFTYRARWFVLSQMDGKPYAPVSVPSWSEERALTSLGIRIVTFDHLDGNVQGYATSNGAIAINPVAALPHKTLFHEVAHVLLKHAEDVTVSRSLREVEAEGVALLCCEALGLDGSEYLRALEVDLFLSKEEQAVKDALAAGISAGLIYGGPSELTLSEGVPVLAFDGDAVLFSDEADRVYREKQLAGFAESELKNANIPLATGPLRRFAEALEELRATYPIDSPPFRIALVTARDLTYCERPMQTLRAWGIRIDQGFFVSDMSKNVVLAALKPLIFFDDSAKNCADACASTPTVRVPLVEPPPIVQPAALLFTTRDRPQQFTTVCKLFLKKNFGQHEATLLKWQEEHLDNLSDESFDGFVQEFERSTTGTPRGRQRRSIGAKNEDVEKLLRFLENLLKKHERRP